MRVDFDDPFDLTPVDIPDSNLRTAIEKDLGKASGAPITTEDMRRIDRGLEHLTASITDLTGLEACNQPDTTGAFGQLNIRHLTAGRIKQPDRTSKP